MKKYLKLLIVIICIFIITGCKSNKLIGNNSEDIIANLYSDENRLVYNNGGIYIIVYTFKDNKVSKLENYYEFDSEEEAKKYYEENKSKIESNNMVTGFDLINNVVVYSFSTKYYKDKTMDDIRKLNDNLKEITKN